MEDKKSAYVGAFHLDLSVLGKASNTLNTLKGLFPDLSEEITEARKLILNLKDLLKTTGYGIYEIKPKPKPVVIIPTIKKPTQKERKAKELKELNEKRDKVAKVKEAKRLDHISKIKGSITNPNKILPEEVIEPIEPKISPKVIKTEVIKPKVKEEVITEKHPEELERLAKIEKLKSELLKLELPKEEVI